MTELTAAQILESIREATSVQIEDDPNWKSSREWAALWGLSDCHVRNLLRDAVKAGVMTEQRRQKRLDGGAVRIVNCYRHVKNATKKPTK